MYGKIFKSMYQGSLLGAGANVYAVWGYVIANAYDSMVELHPVFVSQTLGMTRKDFDKTIKKLSEPDPDSRCQDHEGRRLIHMHEYWYMVPSWTHYQKLASEESRREYMRNYMRSKRGDSESKTKEPGDVNPPLTPVSTCKHFVNNEDEDINGEVKKKKKTQKKEPKVRFLEFVLLTKGEYDRLVESLGKAVVDDLVEELNVYIGQKGDKYKSHYYTILAWHRRKKSPSATSTKTKQTLYPIKGKVCYKKGCSLPAVYGPVGEYSTYYCGEHMPESVKAIYTW